MTAKTQRNTGRVTGSYSWEHRETGAQGWFKPAIPALEILRQRMVMRSRKGWATPVILLYLKTTMIERQRKTQVKTETQSNKSRGVRGRQSQQESHGRGRL